MDIKSVRVNHKNGELIGLRFVCDGLTIGFQIQRKDVIWIAMCSLCEEELKWAQTYTKVLEDAGLTVHVASADQFLGVINCWSSVLDSLFVRNSLMLGDLLGKRVGRSV